MNLYCGCVLEDGSFLVRANGSVLSPKRSQRVRNHSPDGFSWGYGGSGPAQLALAILLRELEDEGKARGLYQEFKRCVVAMWPNRVGTCWAITSAQVSLWVAAYTEDVARSSSPYILEAKR